MLHTTVCAGCGRLHQAVSEEAANEPIETGRPDARWFLDCLLSAPCVHCGRGRGRCQHIGRAQACPGGMGTIFKPRP